MSIVSNNIKYLRRLNGLTQEQFSRRLGIKRSLVGAYEEARANPPLDNLKLIANTFGISVDALIKQDIRKLKATPDVSFDFEPRPQVMNTHHQVETPKPIGEIIHRVIPQNPIPVHIPAPSVFERNTGINKIAQRITLKPIDNSALSRNLNVSTPAPSNFKTQSISLKLVEKHLENEYLNRFQDTYFIQSMPTIQMPKLAPNAEYRAFEAGNDFAFEGALMVGKLIDNWTNIIDGKNYIVIVRGKGILFRKVINQVKIKGTLLLMSDNLRIPSQEISIKDMIEIWEYTSFISYSMPEPKVSVDKLSNLVEELKFEIDRLKQ